MTIPSPKESKSSGLAFTWVILTQGNRAEQLRSAIRSIAGNGALIIFNGEDPADVELPGDLDVWVSPTNIGVPAGRDVGLSDSTAEIIGFLDDDAIAPPGISDQILQAFSDDSGLGVVALRLVDEDGETARRHVPRLGGRDAERGGDVALFLGGASAIRREAYDDAGGYWGELFYGHEELELSWRLIDCGWTIRYLPDAKVFHPRTEIGRHADGWRMTGRNRVMIARRTLPWPVALIHVSAWLALGLARAPGRDNRTAYLKGWRSGWQHPIDRRPIRWRTVWRLTRLGRPPVL